MVIDNIILSYCEIIKSIDMNYKKVKKMGKILINKLTKYIFERNNIYI